MFCKLQDDEKPVIEIMDQLSPVIMESFINVAVSDAVSSFCALLYSLRFCLPSHFQGSCLQTSKLG